MNTIVLGHNHNNTLGLIWSLHEGGHKVILLLYEDKVNYVSKSKFIEKAYLVRRENVIPILKNVASEMEQKPVVFVSGDDDATLLNNHFSEISNYCYFECGINGSINRWRDKDNGNELAQKCGFIIPKTIVIRTSRELDALRIEYPLIIKANNSISGGKAAMKKCDSKENATEFVKGLPEGYFPLQVQEYIEKEYELMLLGCSLYGGKKIICPVANKKILHYPEGIGGGAWSVSLDVSVNDEYLKLAEKLSNYLKEIEYTGNFSAEFLYSRGNYYFLEVNLRNDGTSWLSTCSGYNLPDMVCRSFYDDNVSTQGYTFRQMHYMNIFWDFQLVCNRTLNLLQWLKQFKADTCYSLYYKKDKKPLLYFFINIIINSIKRRVKIK